MHSEWCSLARKRIKTSAREEAGEQRAGRSFREKDMEEQEDKWTRANNVPWQQTTCAALGCVRKALGSRSKGWDPSPLRQQWWGHTGGSVLPSRREMHRVQPVQHRTRRMDQGMGDWTYRRGWDSWGRLARERKGSRDLTNVHKLLKGERKENGARHFSVLARQIRRGNATDWLTLHPI